MLIMSDILRHVHILSTGDVIASSGREVTITQKMLDSLASSYDSGLHKAPIVLGHTSDNEGVHYEVVSIVSELLGFDTPTDVEFSLGWVLRAYVNDNSLFFDIRATDLLNRLVDEGYYQRWSISFYGKDDPTNPSPGDYYIQHLAFLGATPPAFKGLEQIALSEKLPMTTKTNINMDTKAEKYLKALLFAKNPNLETSFVQFSEAPSEDNSWLFNKESNSYKGQYVDQDDQVFDFEIAQDANQKWTVAYNLSEAQAATTELSESTETMEEEEKAVVNVVETEEPLFGSAIINDAEQGLTALSQASEKKEDKKEDKEDLSEKEEDEEEKKKKDKQKTEMSEDKEDKEDKQKAEMSEKKEDKEEKEDKEFSEKEEDEDEEKKKKQAKEQMKEYPDEDKDKKQMGESQLSSQLEQMQEMLRAEQDKNKMLTERMGMMRRDLASQFAEHVFSTYGIDESKVSKKEFVQLAETFESVQPTQLSEGQTSAFDLFKKVIDGLMSMRQNTVNMGEFHKVNLSEKEEPVTRKRSNAPVGTEGFSERSIQLAEKIKAVREKRPELDYEKAFKIVLSEL